MEKLKKCNFRNIFELDFFPYDVLYYILSFLTGPELFIVLTCSKTTYCVINTIEFWKSFVYNRYPLLCKHLNKSKDYKKEFYKILKFYRNVREKKELDSFMDNKDVIIQYLSFGSPFHLFKNMVLLHRENV